MQCTAKKRMGLFGGRNVLNCSAKLPIMSEVCRLPTSVKVEQISWSSSIFTRFSGGMGIAWHEGINFAAAADWAGKSGMEGGKEGKKGTTAHAIIFARAHCEMAMKEREEEEVRETSRLHSLSALTTITIIVLTISYACTLRYSCPRPSSDHCRQGISQQFGRGCEEYFCKFAPSLEIRDICGNNIETQRRDLCWKQANFRPPIPIMSLAGP